MAFGTYDEKTGTDNADILANLLERLIATNSSTTASTVSFCFSLPTFFYNFNYIVFM